MPANEKSLLKEFRRVLKRNADEAFINLDDKFTEKFEFFLQPVSVIMGETGTNIPPNRWSYYRLALVTEGAADYVCGIYKFKAVKNTMIIIPARVITASNWLPHTEGFITLFNLNFFLQNHFSHRHLENKKILQPTVRPFLHLTDEQAAEVGSMFRSILKEKESNDPHSEELIALKLVELIILAERIYCDAEEATVNPSSLSLVKNFAAAVEENFMKEKSVSFYASLLRVHPNYLNSVIKTQTGLTAKESIQNRLMLEAKYLLHNSDLSIKEISNQMGFDDPNYFGVFFKRFEQRSPASYRSSFI